ncbi:MAG: polyprenyl synthetase family protein [Bacteroidota bacterium]|nr:polyprenyl synthetase family protein [Bacteroidota bacterium]
MKDLTELGEIVEKEIRNLTYPKSPELLYDPIEYIMGLQGKRMRPMLVLMAHQLFDENLEKALAPAIAIELFHNFTLLHDDIMDNAPLRRGSQTVHEKWNSNVAILSGDVMMIQAYQLLAKADLNSLKEILDVFSKVAVKVCEGQQWDMNFETQDNVNLVEYTKMIEYKTAALLAASLQIGAITAGANKEEQYHLYEFGTNIGIAFQLKDDLLDVFGSSEAFGKQEGGDILANKKTFLYLKALQLADNLTKGKLQAYYTTNDVSKLKVKTVKDIFKNLNIQKHTINMMKAYYTKAIKHLNAIDSNNKDPLVLFSEKLMERIS